ncbi:MAG: hypothetical protein KBA18_05730 [Kiritimatiellae bacterium]|jgi:hypothetical protein|nr:hypothetical protein [Kiritimatiellia bacterium]
MSPRTSSSRHALLPLFLLALAAGAACAETDGGSRVRGIQGRFALYAATNPPLEAVAWLPAETVLAVVGELTEAPWTPVEAPDTVTVWIYRDLVRDGKVLADKSLVRAGAGMAFRPLASLDGGTSVHVRGLYGDWLKIAPPPNMMFWVLRDQVEPLAEWPRERDASQVQPDLYSALIDALSDPPAQPSDPAAPSDAAPPDPEPPAEPPRAAHRPPELAGFVLDESAVQGERITLRGTLDWGGIDPVSAPFCLVAREPDGDAVALCNLLAPELTYGPHIGAEATVEGTRWFVKDARLPFVIPLAVRLSARK